MKFFHLSDLHIGLKLINRDLKEDQQYILDRIAAYAEQLQPDAIVIAGDVYDKTVPAAEAVELFDAFITALAEAAPAAEIMVVSGNHDSALRLNLFRQVLSSRHIHMIGLPPQQPEEHIETVTLADDYGPVHFYLLPFVKPSMVKPITGTNEDGNNLTYDAALHKLIEREDIDQNERNVLVSHQFYLPAGKKADDVERMESEIRTVGNIDEVKADVLAPFDYAALGHIHKPMCVGADVYRYCGTPLACSVSEAGQQKGVLQVELKEKGTVEITVLPLKPLREVRLIKGTLSEVLSQECDDYVSVLLTDKVDLDVIDMQDRIRHAFPNLLEIRRETMRQTETSRDISLEDLPDTFTLCTAFLGDPDEEEQLLLKDVINHVLENRKDR